MLLGEPFGLEHARAEVNGRFSGRDRIKVSNSSRSRQQVAPNPGPGSTSAHTASGT